MWDIPGRLIENLAGAGGETFAGFVDRLILAEAFAGGLSASEVDCQVRANIPDGGVDTRVRSAVPNDGSGWLSVPTCWQHKALQMKAITPARDQGAARRRNWIVVGALPLVGVALFLGMWPDQMSLLRRL